MPSRPSRARRRRPLWHAARECAAIAACGRYKAFRRTHIRRGREKVSVGRASRRGRRTSARRHGTARAAVGSDLVTVVLRLYRQGGRQTRARCLDNIDRLTEFNVYGIDSALAEER